MNNMLSYAKSTALTMLVALALFIGGGAIVVILEAATWDELSDWTTKAVLVAVVLVVISAVIGMARPADHSEK